MAPFPRRETSNAAFGSAIPRQAALAKGSGSRTWRDRADRGSGTVDRPNARSDRASQRGPVGAGHEGTQGQRRIPRHGAGQGRWLGIPVHQSRFVRGRSVRRADHLGRAAHHGTARRHRRGHGRRVPPCQSEARLRQCPRDRGHRPDGRPTLQRQSRWRCARRHGGHAGQRVVERRGNPRSPARVRPERRAAPVHQVLLGSPRCPQPDDDAQAGIQGRDDRSRRSGLLGDDQWSARDQGCALHHPSGGTILDGGSPAPGCRCGRADRGLAGAGQAAPDRSWRRSLEVRGSS